MVEIEVKAYFHGSYAELLKQLETLGAQKEKELMQSDTIFLPTGMLYGELIPGMPVMRIRDQNGQFIFGMKQKPKNESIGIEHETIVENAAELIKILAAIGFSPALQVKKKRHEYHLDQITICADEVDGLGVFVEVEKLVDNESGTDNELANLWHFLSTLGVKEEDKVKHGYDTLIYRKQISQTSDKSR